MNISLGKSYNLIGMESEDEFNRCMAKIENLHKESVFAFITDEGGQNLYPLYRGDFIYIMTEKGQTFAKIDRTFAKLIYADQTPIKTESTRLTLEELRDYLITGTCQFSESGKIPDSWKAYANKLEAILLLTITKETLSDLSSQLSDDV